MNTPTPGDDGSGYVYVLEAEDKSCYKIGCSKDVTKRILQMRPNLPFKVRLLHTTKVHDRYTVERDLHEMFAYRRRNGEWFELNEADLKLIEAFKLAGYGLALAKRLKEAMPPLQASNLAYAAKWASVLEHACRRAQRRMATFSALSEPEA